MNTIEIIKQLLSGNHLDEEELKEAKKIVKELEVAISTRIN